MISIHPSCGDLDPRVLASFERLCVNLRPGRSMPYQSSRGNYWLARDLVGIIRVSVEPNAEFSQPAKRDPADWIPVFHQLWREIHESPWTHPTPEERHAFVATILPRLPCGECKTHWLAWLASNPPPFDDTEAYFAWGVAAQNAVNVRKGMPVMSLEEARGQLGR